MNRFIICDIDGCLFDNSHRAGLVPKEKGTTEDWAAFNRAHVRDTPIFYRIDFVRHFAELGMPLVFLTGRTETCRDSTIAQLEKVGFPAFMLIMRPVNCFKKAADFKEEAVRELWLAEQKAPRLLPYCDSSRFILIDDDASVCDRIANQFPGVASVIHVPGVDVALGAHKEKRHA